MATFVNHVFVGNGVSSANIDTMSIGDITIVDETGAIPSATSKTIQVVKVVGKQPRTLPNGTVVPNASIVQSSDLLKKEEIFSPEVRVIPAAPAIEQIVELDYSSVVIPASNDRMVVRVLFKDTEGTKTQITRSFEYVSAGGAPIALATALTSLARSINRHSNGALNAVATTTTLTINANPKNTNGGLDWFSTYSQYEFEVSSFVNSTSEAGAEVALPGLAINVLQPATRGAGTGYLVRDRERSGIPYLGNTNSIGFPEGRPELTVDLNKTYDTIVIEYNKGYRSVQEQYMESTPRSIEIYAEAGTGATLGAILTAFYA